MNVELTEAQVRVLFSISSLILNDPGFFGDAYSHHEMRALANATRRLAAAIERRGDPMTLHAIIPELIIRTARKDWPCQCRHDIEHRGRGNVGCVGVIARGSQYIEDVNSAPAYQSGVRLCVPCALVVWAGYLFDLEGQSS